MRGEIISLETAQKIAKLEKENKEQTEIIIQFDAVVNKQWKIITEAYNLLKNYPDEIQEALEILSEGLNEFQRK